MEQKTGKKNIMYKLEKKNRGKNGTNENLEHKEYSYSQGNVNILPQRERVIRSIFIALGIVVIGYIYTESLWAQQAANQRISISQATDFPRDI